MTDSVTITELALSQYSILERIFKHLDYQSTKHMASLRDAWQTHAQRRMDESEVKYGEFLDTEFSERILAKMESTAGPPSVVFFFTVSAKQDFRCRLEDALQSDSASWEKTIIVVAKCFFRFATKDKSLPKKDTVSYLALPAGVPVSALPQAEFCALKNANSNIDRDFLIFTDEDYDYPTPLGKGRKRKLDPEVKCAGVVGGHYSRVWCKMPGNFSLKRFPFLAITVSSVPGRLSVRLGRASKKSNPLKEPFASNPTSLLVFPCAALEVQCDMFRSKLASDFPALIALVGGFTGGEWFGRFSRMDLKEGDLPLMSQLQKTYSFFFVAFTSL